MDRKPAYKIDPFDSTYITLARRDDLRARPENPRMRSRTKFTLPKPSVEKADLNAWLLKRLQADKIRN